MDVDKRVLGSGKKQVKSVKELNETNQYVKAFPLSNEKFTITSF